MTLCEGSVADPAVSQSMCTSGNHRMSFLSSVLSAHGVSRFCLEVALVPILTCCYADCHFMRWGKSIFCDLEVSVFKIYLSKTDLFIVEKRLFMASIMETRFAPVIARDGIDTRNKDLIICHSDAINDLGMSAAELDSNIDAELDKRNCSAMFQSVKEAVMDSAWLNAFAEKVIGVLDYDGFWSEYALAQKPSLKIRIPLEKEIDYCGCGFEATHRKKWCSPCFYDYWYSRSCGCDDEYCDGVCDTLKCGCTYACDC